MLGGPIANFLALEMHETSTELLIAIENSSETKFIIIQQLNCLLPKFERKLFQFKASQSLVRVRKLDFTKLIKNSKSKSLQICRTFGMRYCNH